MKVTIENIAAEAGVGIATVSRVVNNTGYVSKKTREKVEKVINKSGFVPSVVAQNFAKQDSNMMGLIVPEAHNPYFGSAIEGISEVLDDKGLLLVLFSSNQDYEKEKKILQQIQQQNLKGIIITSTLDDVKKEVVDSYKKLIISMKIPVVFMDLGFSLKEWDVVSIDHKDSSYNIIKAMIKKGYEEIGIITGNLETKTARDRYKGYVKALEEYNIEVNQDFVYEGDFTTETAYKITTKMIKSKKYPHTVFTTNNLTTMGFMQAVVDKGLELGKDIECVAYDKINSFEKIKYNYIERNPMEMGKIAAKMLFERIDNPDMEARKYQIPYKLRFQ